MGRGGSEGAPTHARVPHVTRLARRRVIVTGGARGVGAAIVRIFTAEGARVAVLDRRGEEAARLAAAVGGRAYAVDLADVEATREAMDKAIAWLGGLDVLVNNAGILRFGALLDLDPAEWDEVFEVNTRAMLVTTQMAARAMIAFRTPSDDCAGKIVNMAGAGGRTGGARDAHYAPSQAAGVAPPPAAAPEPRPPRLTLNLPPPGVLRPHK